MDRLIALEELHNNACQQASSQPTLDGPSTTLQRWEVLEREFFGLLHAQTHGEGYNAAFYRPLSELIYQRRARFFVL